MRTFKGYVGTTFLVSKVVEKYTSKNWRLYILSIGYTLADFC